MKPDFLPTVKDSLYVKSRQALSGMELAALRKRVRKGEGKHLEFKRKANHPDKIAREFVAFANSEGGLLLVGVDDDQTIYGLKFPQEDAYQLQKAIAEYIFPALPYTLSFIPITAHRTVLAFDIPSSPDKPHFLKTPQADHKTCYVRHEDMSVTASREMVQLLRHEQRSKGVNLHFGDRERKVLQYLEDQPRITLDETRSLLQLNKRKASVLLILLVRAGLLRIHPTEKGDFFTLAEEAFS